MRSTLGLYQPGFSLLHRTPAAVKLLALVVLGVSSVWLQRWWWLSAGFIVVFLAVYLASGLSLRTWWRQIRPMAFILVFTAAAQVWASTWQRAVAITGGIAVLVWAAALVTLTTPTMALVDAVVRACRPLRRFGVDPERVGLTLLLGIRCVPLVAGIAAEVREAQIARRATSSVRAFAVPLIVRALREADALGEALVARGVDD